jgi:hypothetical protein
MGSSARKEAASSSRRPRRFWSFCNGEDAVPTFRELLVSNNVHTVPLQQKDIREERGFFTPDKENRRAH